MQLSLDEQQFFDGKAEELEVYAHFRTLLDEWLRAFGVKAQKTQISFYSRHMFACASFARVNDLSAARR